ncbi:hypothetical protein H5410_036735 [Solanum commersonii]|uniref:Uncharacterized protein n=1 Tax=Solanum commersonii TaxID=4109 RepID=A0A9J5Y6H9_SOLCO|nr:hypothetical protein H5410_036735 [Solanum commersonii]
MNAHNKTQFTYAKIKCALKDSSCDSPISKNLMLTIVASNASPSSTKVFKCPHTRNESIFTHNGLQYKASESNAMKTFKKMNTMHTLTHRFARIFQSTLASAQSRSRRVRLRGVQKRFKLVIGHKRGIYQIGSDS